MNTIKVFVYLIVIFVLIYIFYRLMIKNTSIVGHHTDNIKKLILKDFSNQKNKSFLYDSHYYLSPFSYGSLLDGYDKSKDIRYIAYLLEILCMFAKFVLFLVVACDCIFIIIVFNQIIK